MSNMPDKLRPQEEFLTSFKINEREFRKTKLRWATLESIYKDYVDNNKQEELDLCAKSIVSTIYHCENVRLVTYRLKEPEHLIEKIIRRKIESPKEAIRSKSYEEAVLDLIGIRVYYLFQDEWRSIHDYIVKTFNKKKNPVAYVREGDSPELRKSYRERKCKVIPHQYGYRSIHFWISQYINRKCYTAEIQTRTIFEEGWSEIDHKVRYPYLKDNRLLKDYADLFNRVAGLADEMGIFMRNLKEEMDSGYPDYTRTSSRYINKIKELKAEVKKLHIEKEIKTQIETNIDSLLFRHPLEFAPNYFFIGQSRLYEGQILSMPKVKTSPYLLPSPRRRKYFEFLLTSEGFRQGKKPKGDA